MINAATVLQQLVEWLTSDPELVGYAISRGEPVNEDPSQARRGWVGLYRRTVDYDPRNLGVPPNNYEGTLSFVAVVQRTNLRSGADAEDDLEGAIRRVVRRVVTVPRTHIDTFTDLRVEYQYLEAQRNTMYFQAALVTFQARVSQDVE